MMPTLVLAPIWVIPAQTLSQQHLPLGGPIFPPVFSIYLTTWLCKHMGAMLRVSFNAAEEVAAPMPTRSMSLRISFSPLFSAF